MPAPRPVALAFAVLLAASATGCRHPQDGTVESAVEVQGRERSFLYRLPPGHTTVGRTWPLVVYLHGQMGTGMQLERSSGASDAADRHGFVVVYPDGVDRSWNDRRGATKASDQGVDDVAFVRALIDRFVAEHGVDPDRVYVAGMSNGGMMSFRLACELGDRIAAFSPVGALMPVNGAEACRPARPVPMLLVVGTDDPLVPYGGGTVARDRGEVLSAEATRAHWVSVDGCSAAEDNRTLDAHDDDTRVLESRRSACLAGSEVVLLSVEGGGHTWPGARGELPELLVGKTSTEIDATEEQLRFFEAHPRRPATPR